MEAKEANVAIRKHSFWKHFQEQSKLVSPREKLMEAHGQKEPNFYLRFNCELTFEVAWPAFSVRVPSKSKAAIFVRGIIEGSRRTISESFAPDPLSAWVLQRLGA